MMEVTLTAKNQAWNLRDDIKQFTGWFSRFAPRQWETALLCNDVSHWLGANLESALSSYSAAFWPFPIYAKNSYTHVSQVVELHWYIIFFLTPSSINRWFSDPNTVYRNFVCNHWSAPNNIRLLFRYDYLISNVLLTHCGLVMRDSRFKNFIGITPTDAIYGNIDLSQVMACCPAAPCHHLHQCWLFITKVLVHSPLEESLHTKCPSCNTCTKEFENYTFEITATSSGNQWVKKTLLLIQMWQVLSQDLTVWEAADLIFYDILKFDMRFGN